MITKFRKNHILRFFERWDQTPHLPLELVLNQYLRRNKAIGSKDRKVVSEGIYSIIRWKSLIDAHLKSQKKPINSPNRVEFSITNCLKKARSAPFLNDYEKFGFPKTLYKQLKNSLGEEKAKELCEVTQTRSPTFVRTNLCKTTRESLFHGWKERYDVSLCSDSDTGIIFHEKINFFILPEFKKGLFEVQDEASQLVGNLVEAEPGNEVLDYCAGAGGKSLAFAHKMKGKGQIFLYDLRQNALQSAKMRLRRCGVQNAQIVKDAKCLKKLKKRMDWVLLDVPCTGSGTWRRKPDQRWRYTDDMLPRLVQEQKDIFDSALQYVAPNGKIVYATCSVFPEENEKQMEYFCKKYGLKIEGKPFKSFPKDGKMDGFFAAIFSLDEISKK